MSFFDHPPELRLEGAFWDARTRDRQDILEAVARIPAGRERVLALSPDLARALDEDLGVAVVVDPELVSFSWELR